jgi:site-specific recombinase XerD
VRGAHTGPGVEPARATITKSVVVVSSWYRFLAGGGVPVANPAAAVRRPTPANVSATPALTATENTAWLDALLARARRAGTETAWRDVAHQFLLWDTGLRVTASCLARFEDLHLATRIVDGVPVEYAVLRYRKKTRGRGADWGEVVITPDTLAVLRDYWAVRAAREGVLPERLTGPLLVSTPHGQHPGGRPLDERQVWRRMRVLAGQLGMSFASRVHPHLARATWATLAWEAGVDLIRIRDGLGHSSVSVTERYVRAILSTKDNPGWTIADLRSRSHGTTAA